MKRIAYFIAAVLVVLVVTNPGIREFESHEKGNNADATQLGRVQNYFVCSVYQSTGLRFRKKYFAILGNFYELESKDLPYRSSEIFR